jgi:hypothetical protein
MHPKSSPLGHTTLSPAARVLRAIFFTTIAVIFGWLFSIGWRNTSPTILEMNTSVPSVKAHTPLGATVTVVLSSKAGLKEVIVKVVDKTPVGFSGADGVLIRYAEVNAIAYPTPLLTRVGYSILGGLLAVPAVLAIFVASVLEGHFRF